MKLLALILPILLSAAPASRLRVVSASACDVVRINLAIGMTTQLVFEDAPTVTLFADKQHFQLRTNEDAKRSLAIIPFVEASELSRITRGGSANSAATVEVIDQALHTNLFVFFKNSTQLMFDLRFVAKSKADYIVSINQKFSKDCPL